MDLEWNRNLQSSSEKGKDSNFQDNCNWDKLSNCKTALIQKQTSMLMDLYFILSIARALQ